LHCRSDIPPALRNMGSTAPSIPNKIVWQRRSPWGLAGGSGALTTSGGLLFHMEGDGNFEANDAKSGEPLWHFQTGATGAVGVNDNAGGVPAATYEFANTQYVIAPMGKSLWAFKIGGTVEPRPAPPPPSRFFGFSGSIKELPAEGNAEISMGALRSGVGNGEDFFGNGQEHFIDEFAFVPSRARIAAGARLKWTNLGVKQHTIEAGDGSWTSGPVAPGQSVTIAVNRAGTYEYYCKDHPWSKGQLIVTAAGDATGGSAAGSAFTAEQSKRGKLAYESNCTACHKPDLTAAERAPALAGEGFLQHWRGLNAGELFERIRNTMPQQKPHSLSDQMYVDIIAYLLDSNGLPPGKSELRADPDVLREVSLVQ
jgi:plastocyanin